METLALIYDKDVKRFGLFLCLERVMLYLNELVLNGITDQETKQNLQVRIICNLGDNLGKYLLSVCIIDRLPIKTLQRT